MTCVIEQFSEITWEEFEKVGLQHFANLWQKTVGRNGCISRDSAKFSEHVDIRFFNVR